MFFEFFKLAKNEIHVLNIKVALLPLPCLNFINLWILVMVEKQTSFSWNLDETIFDDEKF